MEDFIRNFDLADYGLGKATMLFVFLGFFFLNVALNIFFKRKGTERARRMNRVIDIIFLAILYIVVAIFLLNALLIKAYGRFFIVASFLILPKVKNIMAYLYRRYDAYVDRI